MLLDAFGVLRERHAVANNAMDRRTFGRGEPLVFAVFPVHVARGSVVVAGRGGPEGALPESSAELTPRAPCG
jgi:hypothetical protein